MAFSPRIRRDQRVLDEPVQVVQVDVGQEWADDPTLWRATDGVVVAPVLHVPRLEQALDQPHKPAVVDVSPDDLQQDRVVDVVETPLDIALDEPDRALPRLLDFPERRVATPVRPEA